MAQALRSCYDNEHLGAGILIGRAHSDKCAGIDLHRRQRTGSIGFEPLNGLVEAGVVETPLFGISDREGDERAGCVVGVLRAPKL